MSFLLQALYVVLLASSPVQPSIEGRVAFVVIVMVGIAKVFAIVDASRFAPEVRKLDASPLIVDAGLLSMCQMLVIVRCSGPDLEMRALQR